MFELPNSLERRNLPERLVNAIIHYCFDETKHEKAGR